jgi:phosphoribosylanthranilate isomerase
MCLEHELLEQINHHENAFLPILSSYVIYVSQKIRRIERKTRMIKLKICGMKDLANIGAVAALHPDYMGFIFYKNSPRYVGDSFSLKEEYEAMTTVGVFVNERTGEILKRLDDIKSTTAQLHGNETPAQCDELRSRGIEVIKVFSVDEEFDFEKTKAYTDVANYFLFDTKGKLYGGNAKTFDWSILEEYDQSVPFFLSGGLNTENVKVLARLDEMNIHAIDLNSGVEDEPGLKNIDKIKSVMSCLK